MPAESELAQKATWHEHYRVRRVSWRHIGGAALVCAPVLLIRSFTSRSSTDVLPVVRLISVTLAAVSVYALDDPARAVTETSCTGRPRLRAGSVGLTFAVVTAVWLPLVWFSDRIAAPTPRLRIPGLYLELLALSATGWVIGAAMASSPTVRFVPARAAGLLAMIVAITLTTPHTMHWFWVGPGTEWNRSHARWAFVAGVALAMFAWASRDPARTRIGIRVNRTIRSPRLRDEEQPGASLRRQP